MGKIVAIALNTFKEAVRNKILYFLLIFALLIMGFSTFVSDLSIAAPDKLIKDVGLASVDFFGFLIAIFVGIYLIYNEIERKTIYTIVSKPIDRSQFVLGKYFGLLFTIYVNMAIMTIFLFIVLYFRDATAHERLMEVLYPEVNGVRTEVANYTTAYYGYHLKSFFTAIGKAVLTFLCVYSEPLTSQLMKVVFLSALGMGIITAFAILYSTFTTPTLSAVFTCLTFVIGHLCEDLLIYADTLQRKVGGVDLLVGTEKFKYWAVVGAMHITPNLSLFNRRKDAIYDPLDVMKDTTRFVELDWQTITYGIVYIGGVLCIACLVFRRRNFK